MNQTINLAKTNKAANTYWKVLLDCVEELWLVTRWLPFHEITVSYKFSTAPSHYCTYHLKGSLYDTICLYTRITESVLEKKC